MTDKPETVPAWAMEAAELINHRNRMRGHVLTSSKGETADVMPTEEMAEIVARHAGGGWISVKDRLPELGTIVVVYKPELGLDLVRYDKHSADHMKFIRRDGQWWDGGKQITYWMLPDPPKEAL